MLAPSERPLGSAWCVQRIVRRSEQSTLETGRGALAGGMLIALPTSKAAFQGDAPSTTVTGNSKQQAGREQSPTG